jgi:hypothetical protein
VQVLVLGRASTCTTCTGPTNLAAFSKNKLDLLLLVLLASDGPGLERHFIHAVHIINRKEAQTEPNPYR